jgi:hypothetical protein
VGGDAVLGVSDHGGWAVLVTVASDGSILDRRRVELVAEGLPKLPHHTEGQRLAIEEAVALVERVRESAERQAELALEAIAAEQPYGALIRGIALRQCPAWLPATIAERIQDYRAQNQADWVMYRQALAQAAEARGWAVHWYDAKSVFESARQALGVASWEAHGAQLKRVMGPPWTKDHQLAMAAAVAALIQNKKT